MFLPVGLDSLVKTREGKKAKMNIKKIIKRMHLKDLSQEGNNMKENRLED